MSYAAEIYPSKEHTGFFVEGLLGGNWSVIDTDDGPTFFPEVGVGAGVDVPLRTKKFTIELRYDRFIANSRILGQFPFIVAFRW